MDLLETQMVAFKARMQDNGWQRTRVTGTAALLGRLKDLANSAEPKTKREVIETLVKEVTVRPGEPVPQITATYLFEDPCQITYNSVTPRTTLRA